MDVTRAMEDSLMARLQERAVGGKSALIFLQEAKKLIEDKSKWLTGAVAKDAAGTSCPPYSKEAVRFSLLGAMEHVQEPNSLEWVKAAELLRGLTRRDLQRWNDRLWRSHGSVLRVIDLAMQKAL